MKPLRLSDPCTLEDAAQWLSRESTEEWTANAVLSRFLEWDNNKTSRAFAPPTLFVVIGPGTELLDKEDQFQPVIISTPWLLAITVPVDRFISDLLLAGEAIPQGLAALYSPFRRYMVTAPIQRNAIRFPREWVEQLLPAYDGLIYAIKQGLHPDLAEELTSIQTDTKQELANWDAMTPEQKKAAWGEMEPAAKRVKAAELVKMHHGNKTAAGAEVGITRTRIGQILKAAEDPSESPLPVNRYTVAAGLVKPK